MSSSGLKPTSFSVKHLPLLLFISFQFCTKPAIAYTHCYPLALFRSVCFQRWQRHTLWQVLACVAAGATCQCVWLLALAFTILIIMFHFVKM